MANGEAVYSPFFVILSIRASSFAREVKRKPIAGELRDFLQRARLLK
jgi:hypothetical protein